MSSYFSLLKSKFIVHLGVELWDPCESILVVKALVPELSVGLELPSRNLDPNLARLRLGVGEDLIVRVQLLTQKLERRPGDRIAQQKVRTGAGDRSGACWDSQKPYKDLTFPFHHPKRVEWLDDCSCERVRLRSKHV